MNDLDRRISVAPMMDWTDPGKIAPADSQIRAARHACRLYVATMQAGFRDLLRSAAFRGHESTRRESSRSERTERGPTAGVRRAANLAARYATPEPYRLNQ